MVRAAGGGAARMTVGAAAVVALAAAAAPPATAAPAGAGPPDRVRVERLRSAEVTLAIEPQGRRREALVVTVAPLEGVRIEPPVLRIDAATLLRARIAVKLPATVRDPGRRPRAVLPLGEAGALRFADPDSHDGTLRVEYRYCTGSAAGCSVERLEVPMRTRR